MGKNLRDTGQKSASEKLALISYKLVSGQSTKVERSAATRAFIVTYVVKLPRMYGPPADCKERFVDEVQSAQMYPASSWRLFSGP